MINYKKLSEPFAPGVFEAILKDIREARELREAFPPSPVTNRIKREHMLDYLEETDEKLGYH